MGQGQSQFEENQTSRHVFKPFTKDQTYQPEDDDDDNVSQAHWQDTAQTDYQTGYAEPGTTKYYYATSEQGEKLVPQYTGRRRRGKRFQSARGRLVKPLLCLLVCIIIIIVSAVHNLSTINFDAFTHHMPQIEKTVYKVGTAPTLSVHVNYNQLYIHVGDAQHSSSVIIQTQNTSAMKSQIDGNTINVTDTSSDSEIDITVPRRIDLQIESDGGNVAVTGINGKVDISTQVASVHLAESTLLTSSQIKTLAGSIDLSAQFDPQGTYLFTSLGGNINVATHPDAAVHFIPSTLAGTIDNQTNSHTSGKGHQAEVTLQTTTGTISIGNG